MAKQFLHFNSLYTSRYFGSGLWINEDSAINGFDPFGGGRGGWGHCTDVRYKSGFPNVAVGRQRAPGRGSTRSGRRGARSTPARWAGWAHAPEGGWGGGLAAEEHGGVSGLSETRLQRRFEKRKHHASLRSAGTAKGSTWWGTPLSAIWGPQPSAFPPKPPNPRRCWARGQVQQDSPREGMGGWTRFQSDALMSLGGPGSVKGVRQLQGRQIAPTCRGGGALDRVGVMGFLHNTRTIFPPADFFEINST